MQGCEGRGNRSRYSSRGWNGPAFGQGLPGTLRNTGRLRTSLLDSGEELFAGGEREEAGLHRSLHRPVVDGLQGLCVGLAGGFPRRLIGVCAQPLEHHDDKVHSALEAVQVPGVAVFHAQRPGLKGQRTDGSAGQMLCSQPEHPRCS